MKQHPTISATGALTCPAGITRTQSAKRQVKVAVAGPLAAARREPRGRSG